MKSLGAWRAAGLAYKFGLILNLISKRTLIIFTHSSFDLMQKSELNMK